MSDTIFYVYQYVNEHGIPFYIGKGKPWSPARREAQMKKQQSKEVLV